VQNGKNLDDGELQLTIRWVSLI